MRTQRKRDPAEFKAKVALEAIREQHTINEIAAEYGVHPSLVSQWKSQLISQLPHIFSQRRAQEAKDHEALLAQLDLQIGQLKVELDWRKKAVRARGAYVRAIAACRHACYTER